MAEAVHKIQVILNRIEGPMAVFELEEGETFELPVKFLPPDCKEGEAYDLEFRRKVRREQNLKKKIADLQRELLNRG